MHRSTFFIFDIAFLIVTGALCFYNTNIILDFGIWLLRKLGLKPQQSPLWNSVVAIYGVVAFFGGLFLLYLYFLGY